MSSFRWHPGFRRVNGKSFLSFSECFNVYGKNRIFQTTFFSDLTDKILTVKVRFPLSIPTFPHRNPVLFRLTVTVKSHILASAVCSIFPKSVCNLTTILVINMDSDPDRNVGRTDLSGDLGSIPAPRETDPTPCSDPS